MDSILGRRNPALGLLTVAFSSELWVNKRFLSASTLNISQFFLFYKSLCRCDLRGLIGDYLCKIVGWQASGLLKFIWEKGAARLCLVSSSRLNKIFLLQFWLFICFWVLVRCFEANGPFEFLELSPDCFLLKLLFYITLRSYDLNYFWSPLPSNVLLYLFALKLDLGF